MYCEVCTHLQLGHNVNRKIIFEDYLYVSGTTKTLMEDFQMFARQITNKHGVGRVLDIACNDGSQLDAFQDLGWQTVGIDPAKNLSEHSSKRHEIYCDFLNESHLTLGSFDVVIAQNVLAHTEAPKKFLEIAGQLGRNIYVQTSQANMIFENQFDTIYHEHLSFFSQKSLKHLAKRSGLVLNNCEIRAIHGNSFLFSLTKTGPEFEIQNEVTQQTVTDFRTLVVDLIDELGEELENIKKRGLPLVGYGAAAKGMTLLNAMGIPLDAIIDDSPLKQGLFTPGMNIPILDISYLDNLPEEIYLIPLAWNFASEIEKRVRLRYQGTLHLIEYFPKIKIS
jgi:SAM-dependent methyltransferase